MPFRRNELAKSIVGSIVAGGISRPRLALLAFILLAFDPAFAQILGQDSRELTFYFTINGYQPDIWFGEPASIALDERSGLLYVADTKAGNVDAFSLQGVPKFQYGAKQDLKAPLGLAVSRDGDVYVSDNEGGPIRIINAKGEVSTLEFPSQEGEDAPKPGRMTFDRDGNLYVVDRANNRIYVFDKEKKLKFKLGGIGDKRGQFKMLQDVAVDRQGRIYGLDSVGVPVQVFDRKGEYIYRFGFRGEGDEDISFAAGVFIDRNDQIWIVDRGRHSLKVFDRSGVFLKRFGSYGQAEASFFHPVDADIDNFGRIYVIEAGSRRLQVFSLSRPFEPFSPQGL